VGKRASSVKALSYRDDHPGRDYSGGTILKPKDLKDQVWIFDRIGDAMNETYQSLNRSDVPRFGRVGYGRVLGTPSGVKINREESSEKRLVLDVPDRTDNSERSLLSTLGRSITKHPYHLRVNEGNELAESAPNFISLNKTRKRKRSPEVLEYGTRQDVLPEGTETFSSDKSSEYESEQDTDLERHNQQDAVVKQRNLELTQLTKSEPHNLQSWQDLIKHQDEMILLGRSRDKTLLDIAGKRGLADIKVMIYKDALAKLSGNLSAQEELWIGLLGEGEILWENNALQAYWKEAINTLPKSAKIRLGYINYLQTNYSSFRFGALESKWKCIITNNLKKTARKNISVALKCLDSNTTSPKNSKKRRK
jgi:hypothetical protein